MSDHQIDKVHEWIAEDVDLVLINPPFGGIDRPSLALHILQAIAREEGVSVKILYANLILANALGELEYEKICYASSGALLGERFFAELAYGKNPDVAGAKPSATHIRTSKIEDDFQSLDFVYRHAKTASSWCNLISDLVFASRCKAVGFTSTFEQTAATIAIAREIKRREDSLVVLVGGANCEGVMADGISALCDDFDYVFTGECESVFRDWCREFRSNKNLTLKGKGSKIVKGQPCDDLDSIPTPDYTDYYFQLEATLPDSKLLRNKDVWLPYETSRGCWWGQKHHCTFCGINGEGMGFRQKSASVVLEELQELTEKHPTNRVLMVDNIMPHSYFSDLLPRLAAQPQRLHIFYEQKANLDFRRMRYLKDAGVEVIQPGIEALDSDLLRHMRKGVLARQNIALLRYALMNNVFVNWNLLHSFPEDRAQWYERTLDLLPLMSHLCPPTGSFGLSIDRFSPYFDQAEAFNLTSITPVSSYFDVLPPSASVEKVAYHFEAHYESESRDQPGLITRMEEAIGLWRAEWEKGSELPKCHILRLDDENYLLVDTRPYIESKFRIIDRARAEIALIGWRKDTLNDDRATLWAKENKVCVNLDGSLIPLATCSTELYLEFDQGAQLRLDNFRDRDLHDPDSSELIEARRP